MSEERKQPMKMNPNQQQTHGLSMNSEKVEAQKPYLTLKLPKELTIEQSSDQSSTSAHYWAHDLRISDNSHSDSNPGQRKKGGCKSVNLSVLINDRSFNIPAKCDVRKSFSNRSFAQYYERSAYAVIPLDSSAGLYLTICEAVKGRDGKFFVAMEKSRCSIDQRSSNSRHPLLAFAAESVYRVVIHSTKNDATTTKGECTFQAKCLFQQGSASVVIHRPASEIKVKSEPVERHFQPAVVLRQSSPTIHAHAAPVAASMVEYFAPPPFVPVPHMPPHFPVYQRHSFMYDDASRHHYSVVHPSEPAVDGLHDFPALQETPVLQTFRPTLSVKPGSVPSVLGKRQRQPETTNWLESKHACVDFPNHFFPLAIENDISACQKMERWDSSSELELCDQMSGCCSPSSPFSTDSDECQSPSSPFSDLDGVDFSSSDEYDYLFHQPQPQPQSRLMASPALTPQPSPFSTPLCWEPFHVNDFSLH